MEKYGKTFEGYVIDALEKEIMRYFDSIDNRIYSGNTEEIQAFIDNQLRRLGVGGIITAHISRDADPTKLGVSLQVSPTLGHYAKAFDNLVFISPENDHSHSWEYDDIYLFKCSKCRQKKLIISPVYVDYSEDYILSNYDLSCSEVLVKDIIE